MRHVAWGAHTAVAGELVVVLAAVVGAVVGGGVGLRVGNQLLVIPEEQVEGHPVDAHARASSGPGHDHRVGPELLHSHLGVTVQGPLAKAVAACVLSHFPSVLGIAAQFCGLALGYQIEAIEGSYVGLAENRGSSVIACSHRRLDQPADILGREGPGKRGSLDEGAGAREAVLLEGKPDLHAVLSFTGTVH